MFETRESLTLETLNKAISDIAQKKAFQKDGTPITTKDLLANLAKYAVHFNESEKVESIMQQASWRAGTRELAVEFYGNRKEVEKLQQTQQYIKEARTTLHEMSATAQAIITAKDKIAELEKKTYPGKAPAELNQKMAACRLHP